MICEQFERWLHQEWEQHRRAELIRTGSTSSDGPVSQLSGLVSHAEACDSCRQRLAAHQHLWDGWAETESPAPPAGFAQAVIARCAQTDGEFNDEAEGEAGPSPAIFPYKPRWSGRQMAIWLHVAAALLLAAFTLLWRGGDNVTPSGLASRGDQTHGDLDPRAEPQIGDLSESDQPRAPRKPRWNPASEMQSLAMFFLSPPDLKTVVVLVNRRVLDLLGDPAKRVDELPGSLRQVARSVNVTIDLLRQALPGRASEGAMQKPIETAPDRGENAPSSEQSERPDVGWRARKALDLA